MTKNPFVNALAAAIYISLVAAFMFYGTRALAPGDSLIMPVSFLSLFVLSAAVMGWIFFYYPIRLYLDGNKEASVSLLSKTILIFAGITIALLLSLLTLFR